MQEIVHIFLIHFALCYILRCKWDFASLFKWLSLSVSSVWIIRNMADPCCYVLDSNWMSIQWKLWEISWKMLYLTSLQIIDAFFRRWCKNLSNKKLGKKIQYFKTNFVFILYVNIARIQTPRNNTENYTLVVPSMKQLHTMIASKILLLVNDTYCP